ncbi:MAG: LPS-assembly protein LptD [Paracoccaceae bacterium]
MARILVLLLALLPLAARAQQEAPATLIADRVAVIGNSQLLAEGHVEVLYQGARLKATRVTYDRPSDRLTIEGPLTLITQTDTVLLADSAELKPDLTEGLLISARMVLRQQLQLAANELHRVGGRYSVLNKTVASSCRVCANSPVPLWQIRARRIVHDEQEKQLYFDHARFEVMGVPILYLPRLRLPDPTLKRATGFLIPELRFSDALGSGLKVPYFITLGRHADLTVTPYVSTGRTRTLELRYRQAFRHGEIELNGALSRDTLVKGETRRYLFGEGRFDLARDFELTFNIQTVSDPAYLLDYGYSGRDRLRSDIAVARTRRDEQIEAALYYYNSLRASENNRTLPTSLADLSYQRRFEPGLLGGIAKLSLEAHAHHRRSNADVLGRDVARAATRLDWRRSWTTRGGLRIAALGELNLDYTTIADDAAYPGPETRAAPFAAVELRWPLVKAGRGGATQVLEPVLQLVWSDDDDTVLPNEDSVSVEFDEGNLFALNRFPGADAYADGLRANLGLSWTRHAAQGWSLALAAGRIVHAETPKQFAAGSGLDGISSDWLTVVRLKTADNLSLTNRAVFDDSFAFTRNELRLAWATARVDLASSYVWQEANLAENRSIDSSEWVLDAGYRFRNNWIGKADWRYDFVADRAAYAGVGLEYRNECVTLDLSLSRRFTSSTSVRPTTDFGLQISLNGFGTGGDASAYRRTCSR